MFLNKNFTKMVFLILLIHKNAFAVEEEKINSLKNQVYNEITHAGPMGMGLTKSYQINNQKICVYNTVEGQEKITLKSLKECPFEKPLTKIYKD